MKNKEESIYAWAVKEMERQRAEKNEIDKMLEEAAIKRQERIRKSRSNKRYGPRSFPRSSMGRGVYLDGRR